MRFTPGNLKKANSLSGFPRVKTDKYGSMVKAVLLSFKFFLSLSVVVCFVITSSSLTRLFSGYSCCKMANETKALSSSCVLFISSMYNIRSLKT